MADEVVRIAPGWVPSNTHPANTTVIASGVDTLTLGYFGDLGADLASELEEKRRLLTDEEPLSGCPFESNAPESEVLIAGSRFALRPFSSNGWRHRLFNADVTLLVMPRGNPPMPTVQAQLRSPFLWRRGWRGAIADVSAIADAALIQGGAVRPPIVERLDLCADFQGWIPRPEDSRRFVKRATGRAEYHEGEQFTGFGIGRGNIIARLYQKTIEIERNGKVHMLAVWKEAGYSRDLPVWRLEFQARREALRKKGVPLVDDLVAGIPRLWHYLSTDWLRLTEPNGSRRRERWPTSSDWACLQAGAFGSKGVEEVRVVETQADIARLDTALLGYLASHARHSGARSVSEAMRRALPRLEELLRRKGVDFGDLVLRKSRRAGHVRPVA